MKKEIARNSIIVPATHSIIIAVELSMSSAFFCFFIYITCAILSIIIVTNAIIIITASATLIIVDIGTVRVMIYICVY